MAMNSSGLLTDVIISTLHGFNYAVEMFFPFPPTPSDAFSLL